MRLRAFGRALAAGVSTVTVASVMLLISGAPATASAAPTATGSCCTVSVNGPAVTLKVTTPGKSAKATFKGKVGQRVAEVLTNPVTSDNGCSTLTLTGPGITPVSQENCGNGNPVGINPIDLTVTGTYTVSLRLDTAATGHGTLWVSAPKTVGTTSVNGSPASMNVNRVGQGVLRTFTGTVGQRVAVVITNPIVSNNACTTLTLFAPNGVQVDSQQNCGDGNPVGINPVDLTISGTYKVRVEVDTVATGTSTLWVSAPITVGTVTVNGPAVPMNVKRVGQGVQRTFHGRAGQQISAVLSNPVTSNDGCSTLTLFGHGMTPVSQENCGNGNPVSVGPVPLPSTGTYTVRWEVDTIATGHGSLRVSR
jgi:hypothetical protein